MAEFGEKHSKREADLLNVEGGLPLASCVLRCLVFHVQREAIFPVSACLEFFF